MVRSQLFVYCSVWVLYDCFTKQVSVAVTHYTHTGGSQLVSRPGRLCCNSSAVISINSAENNYGILLPLGRDRLLLSSFQFVILPPTIFDMKYCPGSGEGLRYVIGCLLSKVSSPYSHCLQE